MPIPNQRDPEETSQRLVTWLAARMPGASELRIENLTPPAGTGFSNDTLLFDLVWCEAGVDRCQSFVVRIQPSGYAIFPEYDLERQYSVMRILGSHSDIPVPKVFGYESAGAWFGAPFYLMSKVEGRIPTDNPPYHVGGWVTEISPEERRSLWLDGLDVLARIHCLDWQKLGFGFLDQPRRGAPGLVQQIHYYEEYFAWAARGRAHPIVTRALEWIRRNLPTDEPLALCWGDARIGNMIFRDGRCQAVLDWEMVALGNPEQDLAWWLFLDRHHSEGLFSERLPGFPSHAETIAAYEELTQRRTRHLAFYEIFAAFRFAIIMMRVAQMMVAYEVLPADSDLEHDNIVTQLLEKTLAQQHS